MSSKHLNNNTTNEDDVMLTVHDDDDHILYGDDAGNDKLRIPTPPLTHAHRVQAAAATGTRFESHPQRAVHEPFLRRCVDEIFETAVFGATERSAKVLEWQNPEELQCILDLELKRSGDGDERLLELLRDTVRYSVKTGHPYFVNQLFSGLDPYALAGQWLTDALNPSVYTYEVSPVFTLMEEVVLTEMRRIVGFCGSEVDGRGDGIFCPGGSIANGYAISCARFRAMPDVKVSGNDVVKSCFVKNMYQ